MNLKINLPTVQLGSSNSADDYTISIMDPQSTDSFQIKHTDFGDAEIDFQMKLMERLDEIEALKKS